MKSKTQTFAEKMRLFEHITDLRTVFDDFLTMTLCSFGQIPGAGKSYDEVLYLETIDKYKHLELRHEFPKLLDCLINEMTERINTNDTGMGWDILGEFYETNLQRKGLSQFFTPWPICMFMAQCSVDEARKSNESNDRPLRILDPSCGSGRMLMAASRIAGAHEEYFGIDIDQTCVKMCAINLFLSGLFHTETMCGNALLDDDFCVSYKTSILPIGVFRIQEKTQSKLWHLLQNTRAANAKLKQEPPDLNPNKYPEGSQMTFF
jgi:hypothetical protein